MNVLDKAFDNWVLLAVTVKWGVVRTGWAWCVVFWLCCIIIISVFLSLGGVNGEFGLAIPRWLLLRWSSYSNMTLCRLFILLILGWLVFIWHVLILSTSITIAIIIIILIIVVIVIIIIGLNGWWLGWLWGCLLACKGESNLPLARWCRRATLALCRRWCWCCQWLRGSLFGVYGGILQNGWFLGGRVSLWLTVVSTFHCFILFITIIVGILCVLSSLLVILNHAGCFTLLLWLRDDLQIWWWWRLGCGWCWILLGDWGWWLLHLISFIPRDSSLCFLTPLPSSMSRLLVALLVLLPCNLCSCLWVDSSRPRLFLLLLGSCKGFLLLWTGWFSPVGLSCWQCHDPTINLNLEGLLRRWRQQPTPMTPVRWTWLNPSRSISGLIAFDTGSAFNTGQ